MKIKIETMKQFENFEIYKNIDEFYKMHFDCVIDETFDNIDDLFDLHSKMKTLKNSYKTFKNDADAVVFTTVFVILIIILLNVIVTNNAIASLLPI